MKETIFQFMCDKNCFSSLTDFGESAPSGPRVGPHSVDIELLDVKPVTTME